MDSAQKRHAVVGLIATLVAALILVFPQIFDILVERVGVRGIAVAGGLWWLLSLGMARVTGIRRFLPVLVSAVLVVGIPALLAAAAFSDSRAPLKLIPPLVHLYLALFFFTSIKGGDSLIYQGARFLVPEVPSFIAPYCRVTTACWGVFFLLSALGVASLSLFGSDESWRLASGSGFVSLIGILSVIEFLIRKTWFRYYFRGHIFDRVWSRWFPAEATPRGRQSLEVIRQFREAEALAATGVSEARAHLASPPRR